MLQRLKEAMNASFDVRYEKCLMNLLCQVRHSRVYLEYATKEMLDLKKNNHK